MPKKEVVTRSVLKWQSNERTALYLVALVVLRSERKITNLLTLLVWSICWCSTRYFLLLYISVDLVNECFRWCGMETISFFWSRFLVSLFGLVFCGLISAEECKNNQSELRKDFRKAKYIPPSFRHHHCITHSYSFVRNHPILYFQ